MTAEEILARLVSFPSVAGRPNGEMVDWIKHYAEGCGATATVLPGPEGDRANLFATVGPRDVPGYVLSGHMDVVPADEPGWVTDPFQLVRSGDRLYGRGTSDMKGFLAAALAALASLGQEPLVRPLHLAFSYDEEIGCRGVPHLIARLTELCAPPLGCVIGEPSGLTPVRAHKGKAAARLTITGRPGHSSRPDQGLNAIHAAVGVLQRAVDAADHLRLGPLDARFAPPYSSLQVGVIHGGEAVNIIPETCSVEVEARAIAGVDPVDLLEPIRECAALLAADGFGAEWSLLSSYPALAPRGNEELAALLSRLTGNKPILAVSYGTEAGLFQAAGLPAIICGPGDIARAHKPNEYIEAGELAAAQRMIEGLGAYLRS
ncbi:acetylornithine deacetylase [Devosia sp.]|uniref:acetylornithine deacetylase n=1 Tax=Devosia sp. TaxID=1871048 RepID=UPI002FC9F031